VPATIEYYQARTADGSTLNQVVNAWVLARGDRARSWRVLRESLVADLDDTQGGTTREGIHLGAMAGGLDMLQRGYGGIEVRDDALWFDPHLPDEVASLRFDLLYRGHSLAVSIGSTRLRVTAEPCAATPIRIVVAGRAYDLGPGETVETVETVRDT
jgi:trehalose/maltose hydrolase-like predicted phosphorylase